MRFIPDIGAFAKPSDPVRIDAADRKLLLAYAANARQSIAQLARAARIGKDSARYRLARLTKAGIIHPARVIADLSSVGYDPYHVFLQLKNPTTQVESELAKQLSALPFVRAVIKFFGQYDFEIALVAKNVREFDEMLTQIIDLTKKYLQRHDIFVITKNYVTRAFPKSFGAVLIGDSKISGDKKELDNQDLAILHALKDDAAQSLVSVGQKIGMHPDTIAYRLRNMERWFILGYAPVISYVALGYTVNAVFCTIQHLDEHKEATLKEFLESNPNVLWAVKTVGRRNVLLYICTKSEDEYQHTITDLRNTFPEQILDLDMLSAVAEYKYTIVPQILFDQLKQRAG